MYLIEVYLMVPYKSQDPVESVTMEQWMCNFFVKMFFFYLGTKPFLSKFVQNEGDSRRNSWSNYTSLKVVQFTCYCNAKILYYSGNPSPLCLTPSQVG
jgi:hypothetical protein